MKPKLLIISGPTACKTKLALKLARDFDGELLSADSRQVYREMDVVTGKEVGNFQFSKSNFQKTALSFHKDTQPSDTESKKIDAEYRQLKRRFQDDMVVGFFNINRIKLWGLDIAEPNQEYDVSHFIQYSQIVISDIWERGKLPIIVGGTGFWIRSLLNQPDTVGVPINRKLRQEIAAFSLPELQQTLKKTDLKKWEGMNNSDRNNPRRLVRAIEIGKYINSKSEIRNPEQIKNKQISNIEIETSRTGAQLSERVLNLEYIFWVGLKMDKEILAEKIRQRVLQRIKDGSVEETKKLATKFGWDIPSMTGIGYQDLRPLIEGKITVDQAIDNWTLHEIQYAKRQMTWFTKEEQIKWFDVQDSDFFDRIKRSIQSCLYTTKSHE